MTQKDRLKRPDSYQILRETVEALLAGETGSLPDYPSAKKRIRGRPTNKRRRAIVRTFLVGLLVVAAAWAVLTKKAEQKREQARALAVIEKAAKAEFRIVVAPFSGATDSAREEGAVMQQLLFSEIAEALSGEKKIRVLCPEDVAAPRVEEEALDLAKPLYADAIIWGRVVELKGETVIEPMITTVGFFEDTGAPFGGYVEPLRSSVTQTNALDSRVAKAKEVADLGILLAARGVRGSRYLLRGSRNLELMETIDTTESLFLQGMTVFEAGEEPRAQGFFERCLAQDPEYLPAIYALAELHSIGRMNMRNPEKAYRWLQTAFEIDPDFSRFSEIIRVRAWWRGLALRYFSTLARLDHRLDFANDILSLGARTCKTSRSGAGAIAIALDWANRTEEARDLASIAAETPGFVEELPLLNLGLYADLERGADAKLKLLFSGPAQPKSWATKSPLRFLVVALCCQGEYEEAHAAINRIEQEFHDRNPGIWQRVINFVQVVQGFESNLNTGDSFDIKETADRLRIWVNLRRGGTNLIRPKVVGNIPSRPIDRFDYGTSFSFTHLAVHTGNHDDLIKLLERPGEVGNPSTTEPRPGLFQLAVAYLSVGQEAKAKRLFDSAASELRKRVADYESQYLIPKKSKFGRSMEYQYSPFEVLLRFHEGQMTEAEVLAYQPVLGLGFLLRFYSKGSWDCDLSYHLGAYLVAIGDTDRGRVFLKKAEATEMCHRWSWFFACQELENLKSR